MPLKKIQNDVDEWVSGYKIPYWKPHEILCRLSEETGELAREINHRFGPKKKKSSEDIGDVSGEIGDIMFTLVCLSNSLGIDMNKSWKLTMDKCYGRDKDRFEKND